MHSPFFSASSFDPRPPTRHSHNALRTAVHRLQRRFLALNAVPLAVGILAFPSTDIASTPLAGSLNVGLTWGFLQCGVFVASAWWYERSSAATCDPLGQPPQAPIASRQIGGRR